MRYIVEKLVNELKATNQEGMRERWRRLRAENGDGEMRTVGSRNIQI